MLHGPEQVSTEDVGRPAPVVHLKDKSAPRQGALTNSPAAGFVSPP